MVHIKEFFEVYVKRHVRGLQKEYFNVYIKWYFGGGFKKWCVRGLQKVVCTWFTKNGMLVVYTKKYYFLA